MTADRYPAPASRGDVLAGLATAGLVVTALGFLGAGIDPGPGPRAVTGAPSAGPLYLPPFLTGLAVLAVAAVLRARRGRWAPAAGAGLAMVLLAGALTFGSAAVSWRLTHPGAVIGFTEDTAQLAGEVIAIAAGIAGTVARRAWPRERAGAGTTARRQATAGPAARSPGPHERRGAPPGRTTCEPRR